jgi:uncharacterized MAPEG superfamily protein
MLLGFAGWTLLVLGVGVGMRRWLLIFTGHAGPASFPGDEPHGSPAYRRAVRAHANCVENLPVFGAIVLVAAVSGRGSPALDALAVVVLAARIAQTLVHMLLPVGNATVSVRFTFYMCQFVAMIAMGVLILTHA